MDFPTSLPCVSRIDGYAKQANAALQRYPFDAGNTRQRRIHNRMPLQIQLAWRVNNAQLQPLFAWLSQFGYDWFNIELSGLESSAINAFKSSIAIRTVSDISVSLMRVHRQNWYLVTCVAEYQVPEDFLLRTNALRIQDTRHAHSADTLVFTSVASIDILANLVSWWTFDENAATPTYADSHGTNHLTQRNAAGSVNTSVNSTTGGANGSRRWSPVRTNNLTSYLPRSNTALDMVTDTDFSFGGWFHAGFGTDYATTCILMGRLGQAFTAAKMYMYLSVSTSNQFNVQYSNGSSAVTVNSGHTCDIANRALVVGTYNKTAGLLEIRVHMVSGVGFTKVTAALSGAINNTSQDSNFVIGECMENDGTFNVNVRNGVDKGDECFYVNKAITDAEFAYLYNSGSGKTYAQLVADS
jgi:hypothetical protein